MPGLSLMPERAGHYAGEVDALFAALTVITGLTVALVLFLLVRFSVQYRESSDADRSHRIQKTWRWEVAWTGASFLIFIGLAIWGADLYLRLYQQPADALEIFVIGKQWMWKTQHPGGQREIDELHVPVDRPVRLVMTSQDVIHSFFIPALRIKHDVLPGRYETMWFRASRTGTFWLTCAEYCGTDHSRMGGRVVVMEPRAYQDWLGNQNETQGLAAEGAALFRQFGCSGCHGPGGTVRAPPLEGVFGGPVALQSGEVVIADERYIRDSILMPRRQVAAGYAPIMPSFAGQIGEEDLIKLVAYIKSLSNVRAPVQR